MKKLLTLLLMITVLAATSVVCVSAETTEGDWTYLIGNDAASITGYSGSDADLQIPETLGGYPVISINYGAILGKTQKILSYRRIITHCPRQKQYRYIYSVIL